MATRRRSTRTTKQQSSLEPGSSFGTIKQTENSAIDPQGAAVLAALKAGANPKNAAGMAHFGIVTDGRYGLSVPALRAIAKQAGRDHDLALALWATGQPEARIIACMVVQAPRMTSRQADAWARGIDSWDVCDGFAYDLMSRTSMRWTKPAVWARSKHEFVRRAAFALIAGLAVHDKEAHDDQFIALLPLIESAADDDRNFVKKAVNWALRQIGKRNLALNKAAIACAQRLRAREARSARWIAAGALRELQSDAVQRRLITKGGGT